MRRWVEIERNGRTIGTFQDDGPAPARSHLAFPHVISDAMPAAEHIDGRFYESKSAFRRVTHAHGMIEVGNEKPKPKRRATDEPGYREKLRGKIKDAVAKVEAGHYERHFHPDGTRRVAAPSRDDDT